MTVLSAIRTSFSRSTDALVSPKPDEHAAPALPPAASIVEEDESAVFSGAPLIPPAMRATLSADTAEPAPAAQPPKAAKPAPNPRRWTLQRLLPPRASTTAAPHSLNDLDAAARAAAQSAERAAHAPKLSASERRAQHSAAVVRALIVGPELGAAPAKPAISKSDISKTKAALLQPREANKVIARLRTLPPADAPASAAPIHAVCLALPEAEADARHFHLLKADAAPPTLALQPTRTRDINAAPAPSPAPPTVASATFASVSDAFGGLDLVSLVATPDFGLGGPANGPGILSGALPSAEAVVDGLVQITPQLMSLGYATGRAIVPNHTGIYPPTDRMSVLTYWWGLEVVMPHPTMAYLAQAQSVSHTVMNFLSALAMMNAGVREILPFVRYISQFMEFEFSAIQGQDKGKGVVCAATWIMPAAMVPRPWDFADPPPAKAPAAKPHTALDPITEVPSAPELPVEQEPPSEKEPADVPEPPAQPPAEDAPAEDIPRPVSPPSPLPPLSLFPGGLSVGNT